MSDEDDSSYFSINHCFELQKRWVTIDSHRTENQRKEENYERIPFGQVFWDKRSDRLELAFDLHAGNLEPCIDIQAGSSGMEQLRSVGAGTRRSTAFLLICISP